jgi:hypothetical protein
MPVTSAADEARVSWAAAMAARDPATQQYEPVSLVPREHSPAASCSLLFIARDAAILGWHRKLMPTHRELFHGRKALQTLRRNIPPHFPSRARTGSQSAPGGCLAKAFARAKKSADGLSKSATRSKKRTAPSKSRRRQRAKPSA